MYDENSKEFINVLTHEPQEFNQAIKKLSYIYEGVEVKQLRIDFWEFIENLGKEGFIVMGETLEQISQKNNETINLHMDIPPIKDLTIEITNCCNERCIHCYLPNHVKNNGIYMDVGKITPLIDEFVTLGGSSVTLTGGEVFMHKELINLLLYINSKHLDIIIHSNLIALSEKHLQNLREVNISYIQVSLYGINPYIHDTITRVKGSCARTLKSIELLQKSLIPIKIACPVMKANKDDVINVIEYAKKHLIPIDLELNITAREDQSKDNLVHRLSIDEMESFLNSRSLNSTFGTQPGA